MDESRKEIVCEMMSVGLEPCRPILSYRSSAKKLGKIMMKNPPKDMTQLPPHLMKGLQRASKIRSTIVVPIEGDPSAGLSNLGTVPLKDESILIDPTEGEMDLDAETFKGGKLGQWQPTFYPVYKEPSFPLPDLSVEAILCLCDEVPPIDQIELLLSTRAVAENTDIRIRLF